MTPPTSARPFCKWAGGKTALLPEILSRLPEKIGTYYEPFVGGGAVFFAHAAEKRFKQAVLVDKNEDLIRAYRAIAENVDAVIRELKKKAYVYEEDRYYQVRALNPAKLDPPKAAARFIYLNRTCFNGLYRVNSKGRFNVPFGKYVDPTICDEENLRAVSKALGADVSIYIGDFQDLFDSRPKKGDAVYFDPPYAPASDTANFTAYTKGGFGEVEQTRLRDYFALLVKRGVHVLLSNSNTPLVRRLYRGFRVEEVEAPRRVNSKGGKRGNVTELLISGRDVRTT